MMLTTTMTCLPPGRGNGHARMLRSFHNLFTPAGSSTLPPQSEANQLDVKANHRNRQRGRGIQVLLEPSNECPPSPFASSRSKPTARPRRDMLSCPPLLQLRMRQAIPLGHQPLRCILQPVQRMWLCGSERIVKLLMSKLRVRRNRPSRWTTRSRSCGHEVIPQVCFT